MVDHNIEDKVTIAELKRDVLHQTTRINSLEGAVKNLMTAMETGFDAIRVSQDNLYTRQDERIRAGESRLAVAETKQRVNCKEIDDLRKRSYAWSAVNTIGSAVAAFMAFLNQFGIHI